MPNVPSVSWGFFPLDEELELLPGSLTPHSHENLVRLSSWMPYEKAVIMLASLTGVVISKSAGRRYTQAAGKAYVEIETEEAEKIEREVPEEPSPGSEKMVMSADGAMVPLVGGEWAEVKTLALGEVVSERGEVQVKNITYFSRLADARQFEHLSLSEIHRRGIGKAEHVAAVMDGAEWLQSLIDYHCPSALRILDFPHAGQRFGEIAQSIWGEGSPKGSQWTKKRLHQLKHQGPTRILRQLKLLAEHAPENEILSQNLAYLEKRQAQMQYPHYQNHHWPIGSGMVESANKLVVEARLKGAGMHWKRENVNPMLALRNIVCNNRWDQEWSRISRQLRHQALQRKKLRYQKSPPDAQFIPSTQISPAVLSLIPAYSKNKPSSTTTVRPNNQQKTKSRKPSADHPWRHSPIGRARYQSPKK